ncbi:MAG TPA: Asp-tRNA(Asn)/Glu-tRNA(Gln) amidotransferase subunit GatA [Terriglobales bacterium]|nr:Asp-tRNA(Asn)/Glu-tRNA(Gln) amidotransferase subunit GatA [Terriglobales bacterium]
MKDCLKWNIGEMLAALERREVSAVELTRAHLERAAEVEPAIHAFLRLEADDALLAAENADRRRAAGEEAPLLGVPIAVKDVILTRDQRTTAASRILENFIAPYDATVSARLKDAGAILIGKLNCDEFAMGSSTENSGFTKTHNPWRIGFTPGGSSGGSAAAVCARECGGALGTDTGGSIRQPAALCGIVGMKPTYGRVSRYGVIAYASSLDQVGPMARDVDGCARILQVIAGHDPRDSTSVPLAVPDYVATVREAGDLQGVRIGVPSEYFVEGMQPEVETAVRSALRQLEGRGASLHQISLPHTAYAVPTYYLVATAEASSNLARYDGIRYGLREGEGDGLQAMYRRTRARGFGDEVKRRIMLGTYALSAGYYDAYYNKALKVRTLIRRDFEQAFSDVDVIVTPTTPTTAFRLGEKTDDPLAMYLADIFTIAVNLAGLPGLSLPCGLDASGLPIGLQIIAAPFAEEKVLAVARAYEQAQPWKLPELP